MAAYRVVRVVATKERRIGMEIFYPSGIRSHVRPRMAHGPSILGRETDRCLWPEVDIVILIARLTTWDHQDLLLLD